MKTPKVSIITINYNDFNGLVRTVTSVKNQVWGDFEHIIIDGGSTDGSKNYLEENGNNFSYWVSETDKGIYNAMNKGIMQAKGDYLLMLNAGDVLHNDMVLHDVFSNTKYSEDLIYGDVDRESKGTIFTESIFPDTLTFGFLRNGMISHQAVFFKKSLHTVVGLYDETIKYGADWHFIILAVCKYNATYVHLKLKMAVCNADGLTANSTQFDSMAAERTVVLKKEFPAFLEDYLAYDEIESKKIRNRAKEIISNTKAVLKNKLKK
jgi:glycosyltransferase involved in cell wall biosynthesis